MKEDFNTETAAAVQGTEQSSTNQNSDLSVFFGNSGSKDLEKLKPQFSVVPTYLEIEKKPIRAIYAGIRETSFQQVNKTTGEVETKSGQVAVFIKDSKMYVNRGIQLLRSLEESNLPKGTPVELSLSDTKKNATGGSTKIYEILVLN